MPSRWDSATCGWRRRVFHYAPPTLMSRNFRLPRAIELRPLSLTPLKMRKVEQSCAIRPVIARRTDVNSRQMLSSQSYVAASAFEVVPDSAVWT